MDGGRGKEGHIERVTKRQYNKVYERARMRLKESPRQQIMFHSQLNVDMRGGLRPYFLKGFAG